MALAAYFDGGSDFVLERFSPDGLTTFSRTGRITRLDHKRLDVTMKGAAVVIVGGTKGKKVLQSGSMKHLKIRTGEGTPGRQIYLRCLWHSFAEYFDFEVTE
jgi:hypothetical protein